MLLFSGANLFVTFYCEHKYVSVDKMYDCMPLK